MKTHSSFSLCIAFMFLILATHIFTLSDAGVGREGSSKAQVISDLGESPIGPKYREKRFKETLTITSKVGPEEEDEDEQDDDESGQSEQDEDDNDSDENDEDEEENEDEDEADDEGDAIEIEEKSEGHSEPLSPTSAVRKNLSLLKSTRKSLSRYVREDSALNKLMSENSELAKEVGVVLRQLAKREATLDKEMESLKEALDGAVVTLKNTIREEEEAEKLAKEKENEVDVDGASGKESEGSGKQTRLRFRRHFNYQKNPYRACVEIERIGEEDFSGRLQNSASSHSQYASSQAAANLATIREFMPSKTAPSPSSYSQSSQYQSVNEPIKEQYSSYESKETYHQQPPPSPPRRVARPLPMIPQTRPLTEVHSSEKQIEVHSTRNNNGPTIVQQSYQTTRNSDQPNQQTQFRSSVNQDRSNNQDYSQFNSYQNTMGDAYSNAGSSQFHQASQFQGSANNYNDHMNDVDLNEVYWLRLDPQRKQELLRQKLDNLLKEKQSQNKDVLVIPLKHGLQDTEEVKNGFLRAVRVRPKALTHKIFRKLRSLQVYEL